MKHLVLCTSFSVRRRSRILGERLAEELAGMGDDVEVLQLADLELPFCDGGASYGLPQVATLRDAIMSAATVTFAVPIHNYDAGGGARNAIAMGGDAWTGKIVGFVCAAGGQSSYMSVLGLANSLMLDYRCLVVPRFVYATGRSFREGVLQDEEIEARLRRLGQALHQLGEATAGLDLGRG